MEPHDPMEPHPPWNRTKDQLETARGEQHLVASEISAVNATSSRSADPAELELEITQAEAAVTDLKLKREEASEELARLQKDLADYKSAYLKR